MQELTVHLLPFVLIIALGCYVAHKSKKLEQLGQEISGRRKFFIGLGLLAVMVAIVVIQALVIEPKDLPVHIATGMISGFISLGLGLLIAGFNLSYRPVNER